MPCEDVELADEDDPPASFPSVLPAPPGARCCVAGVTVEEGIGVETGVDIGAADDVKLFWISL